MKKLGVLKTALQEEIDDKVAFRSIAVRIFLRTGVNLVEASDDEQIEPALLEQVEAAARDMGYLS